MQGWQCYRCGEPRLDEYLCPSCGVTPSSDNFRQLASLAQQAPMTEPEVATVAPKLVVDETDKIPMPVALGRQTSEVVLTAEELIAQKTHLLQETADAMGVSLRIAATLLRRCRWDANRLVEQCVQARDLPAADGGAKRCVSRVWHACRYVERGNELVESAKTVCDAAGNTVGEAGVEDDGSDDGDDDDGDEDDDNTAECLTCMEDFDKSELYGLSCGHLFCKACWQVRRRAGCSCS